MKRLSEGLEIDRLIFLARSGGFRLRAKTSGVIEVGDEHVTSIAEGPSDASGFAERFLRAPLVPARVAGDTIHIDQFSSDFENAKTEPGHRPSV
jgi:hypothetical protein